MKIKMLKDWDVAVRGIHVKNLAKDETYESGDGLRDLSEDDCKLAIELKVAEEVKATAKKAAAK